MTEEEYVVCACIRMDCWHPHNACEEPPKFKGKTCEQCRTFVTPPKCPTCGQPIPSMSEPK